MKKSELRKMIKEEIQRLNELDSEDGQNINKIVDDIITNFKKITKKELSDMVDFDAEGIIDQEMIDKTFPSIEKYVQKKYKINIKKDYNGEILYKLDDAIINGNTIRHK